MFVFLLTNCITNARFFPGTLCLYSIGTYWLDPNGGSTWDAILVHCTFDTVQVKRNVKTCVFPLDETFGLGDWVKKDGDDGYRWFIADIMEKNYGKVRYLDLHLFLSF